MKIGDLVTLRDELYIVLAVNPTMVQVFHIKTNTKTFFPEHWLEAV
tara:strand:+ start:1740 stop:1877 length:138 start_codon:yes stop_codon:yes gene_type:complete